MNRIRKAWAIRTTWHDWRDPDSIYYAPTAGAAKGKLYRDMEFSGSFRDFLKVIRSCRRAPESDIHLPEQHPLTPQLSPRLVDMVVHAYGGKSERAGYRDYFYTSLNDWQMQACVYHGLFERYGQVFEGGAGRRSAYFALTCLGAAIARGELPTYPRF